jgi:hypothetical protein
MSFDLPSSTSHHFNNCIPLWVRLRVFIFKTNSHCQAEVLDKLDRGTKLLQLHASQTNQQFVLSTKMKTILGETLRPVFHRVSWLLPQEDENSLVCMAGRWDIVLQLSGDMVKENAMWSHSHYMETTSEEGKINTAIKSNLKILTSRWDYIKWRHQNNQHLVMWLTPSTWIFQEGLLTTANLLTLIRLVWNLGRSLRPSWYHTRKQMWTCPRQSNWRSPLS